MPDALTKLVESEDELLIELLSDNVEDQCGVTPTSLEPRADHKTCGDG